MTQTIQTPDIETSKIDPSYSIYRSEDKTKVPIKVIYDHKINDFTINEYENKIDDEVMIKRRFMIIFYISFSIALLSKYFIDYTDNQLMLVLLYMVAFMAYTLTFIVYIMNFIITNGRSVRFISFEGTFDDLYKNCFYSTPYFTILYNWKYNGYTSFYTQDFYPTSYTRSIKILKIDSNLQLTEIETAINKYKPYIVYTYYDIKLAEGKTIDNIKSKIKHSVKEKFNVLKVATVNPELTFHAISRRYFYNPNKNKPFYNGYIGLFLSLFCLNYFYEATVLNNVEKIAIYINHTMYMDD